MYLYLCALLIVGAVAQAPPACSGPKQFEGRFQRIDRERRNIVRGAIVYDETMRRVAEFEDEDISGQRQALYKIKLYNENKEYILDLKTRKCNVTTPRIPFHPYGVPDGFKFMYEASIGAAGLPGEYAVIANYQLKTDKANFFVGVTEPHCFPVAHVYSSPSDGLEYTSFYDLLEGITKPEAFDIPRECAQF